MNAQEELGPGFRYYEPSWFPTWKRQLAEIQRYADRETSRLGADLPSGGRVRLNYAPFQDAGSGSNCVLWKIEPAHQARKVDHAIYLFVRALTLFGATASLGSNQSGKANGTGKFYPLIRMKGNGRFSLMRVICDARVGQAVTENRRDFRNHLRQSMGVTDLDSLWRKSKYVHGRTDILEAAAKLHSQSGPVLSGMIAPSSFNSLLKQLLDIADRHAGIKG